MSTFAWPWVPETRLTPQTKPDHAERRVTYRNDPTYLTPGICRRVLGIYALTLLGRLRESDRGIALVHRKRPSTKLAPPRAVPEFILLEAAR